MLSIVVGSWGNEVLFPLRSEGHILVFYEEEKSGERYFKILDAESDYKTIHVVQTYSRNKLIDVCLTGFGVIQPVDFSDGPASRP